MTWAPMKPYDELPPLPPAADLKTPELLERTIAARAALAELKGILEVIPDPAILINSITLQEARSSSEIENVVTTSDKLYAAAAEAGKEPDSQTKEVLAYRGALWDGFEELKASGRLTSDSFVRIVQRIKQNDKGVRDKPGTVIKSGDTVVYTPPVGEERLREMLVALEGFIAEDGVFDPLVRMAVSHYQFEAIHPFWDGNGRTGRILNILSLVQYGLLPLPVLYLSRFIIHTKSSYYKLLREVTSKAAWAPWIAYMLEGVRETSTATVQLVRAVRDAMQGCADLMQRELPKDYSHELVCLLFEKPYCRIGDLVDANVASRNIAAKRLDRLCKLGVLEVRQEWRDKIFLNTELCRILAQSSPVATEEP